MEYTDQVMEHFKNPRNVGEIDDPSGRGKVGNPVCGDIMELHIKVDDNGVITDARFKTFGCGAAIASSSMLTELIKGKTIEEVKKLSNETVLDALGGLPPTKVHCSLLAEEALNKAIDDYYQRENGAERPEVSVNKPLIHKQA